MMELGYHRENNKMKLLNFNLYMLFMLVVIVAILLAFSFDIRNNCSQENYIKTFLGDTIICYVDE